MRMLREISEMHRFNDRVSEHDLARLETLRAMSDPHIEDEGL